ncbi:hypothetical protein TNCV_4384351 [Trichonephila clavipes]|nr:hypothetical protein TNCV_4384351 [Trichonephila clavipes]
MHIKYVYVQSLHIDGALEFGERASRGNRLVMVTNSRAPLSSHDTSEVSSSEVMHVNPVVAQSPTVVVV